MSVETAIELCEKYSKATEYFDNIMENRFVEMPPLMWKAVNNIGKQILNELENE